MMTEATIDGPAVRRQGFFQRLFGRGDNFDFVGQSRRFLIMTIIILVVIAIGTFLSGMNFSIEFTGGTAYTVTGAQRDFTADDLTAALAEAGVEDSIIQIVDGGEGAFISTPPGDEIGSEGQRAVFAAVQETTGADEIAVNAVGPRWGQQITKQSIRGLLVFLILVALYLALRFEWRMAVSAIATLLHDIVITVGIYAIVGFQVSPASIIAFLTILGYSLYDTVIVFDRVNEDTAKLSSMSTRTYGEVANDALNEVLVRSLSTSITALLPVGSLLFIGAQLLGAETLQDLALALFIGMAVGAYSSIVVATPLLVWLKEKEPRWAELKQRVESRRGAGGRDATAVATAGATGANTPPPRPPRPSSKKSRAQRRR
jgi:preprotein translocase subunit SecF